MGGKYASYDEWWRLFDALCIERGHVDNSQLAGEYCSLAKKKADGAYETALKSLNNWRKGLHMPSRRNFRLLTLLLGIEVGDEALLPWNRLYEEAQRRKPTVESENGEPNGTEDTPEASTPLSPVAASRQSRRWRIAVAAALALLVAGVGMIGLSGWPEPQTEGAVRKKPEPGPPVIDMTGERLYWRELSEVKIGESVVIHAKRGRCGEQPPSWEETFAYLPELATGIWSDGGVGYRVSRSCGGATSARAVVFTATRPGEERFMLYEDSITIRVAE